LRRSVTISTVYFLLELVSGVNIHVLSVSWCSGFCIAISTFYMLYDAWLFVMVFWFYRFESRSGEVYSIPTVCDKVCQWLVIDQWFSPGISVSSTNKTVGHDITEILLKVALNTITPSICDIIAFNLLCGQYNFYPCCNGYIMVCNITGPTIWLLFVCNSMYTCSILAPNLNPYHCSCPYNLHPYHTYCRHYLIFRYHLSISILRMAPQQEYDNFTDLDFLHACHHSVIFTYIQSCSN